MRRLAVLCVWLILAGGVDQGWAQSDAGLIALRAGRYQDAIDYWQQELRAGRAGAPDVRYLVDALMQIGRYDDAIDVAQEYGTREDGHELANGLGEALYARGRVQAAARAFERSIRLRAQDALRAELNLAVLEFESGRHQEAMRRFEGFIDVYNRPDTLDSEQLTAVAIACTYLGLERPELFHDAVRAFDEAIAADPGNLEPRLLLGELFLDKYDSGEAQALIREVVNANPRHARGLLADARRQHFDGSLKAMDRLREALDNNPSLVAGRVFTARLLLVAERYGAAVREAEAALEINPRSLPALAMLASARYLQGDDAGFEAAAARAREINPRYGELYTIAAEMAVQNRLYAAAVDLAQRAVQVDPESWPGHGTLGINQLRIGQIEQGRASLERAFAGDPFNVWFKNTLDLLDTFERYRTVSSAHFSLFIEDDQADLIALYMGPLADEAFEKLAAKYGHRPTEPVRVEVFKRHADFSVRTVGLAGLGALGVAFGPVVAVDAPVAAGMGAFNWGSTLWHEIAHVVTLSATDSRIPRWLTEGLSVFEERRAREGWGEEVDPGFLMAYLQGRLLPVSEINEGFVRPRYPEHVSHSYLQASLVCEFIDEEHGFEALRAMLVSYRDGKSTSEALRDVLGLGPEQLDERFDVYMERRFGDRLAALRPAAQRQPAPSAGHREAVPEPVSLDELTQRVEQNPGDFVARLQLGVRLYEERRDEEAVPQLEAARVLFPEHAGEGSAYAYLARIHEQRGDLELAIEALQDLVSYNEASYDAHIKLAALQVRLGRSGDAVEVLNGAMYINPFEIPVHERLAELLQEQDDWPAAVLERRAVVALAPVDRALALYQLAVAYQGAGDLRSARRAVLESLEIAPGYRPAQELLLRLRATTTGGGS